MGQAAPQHAALRRLGGAKVELLSVAGSTVGHPSRNEAIRGNHVRHAVPWSRRGRL